MAKKVTYASARVARTIVQRRKKILLVLSKKRGEWEFPGGNLKRHETYATAAVRELFEECGLQMRAASLYCVVRHDIQNLSGQRTTRTIKQYFKATSIRNWEELEAQASEIMETRWFTLEEALALTTIKLETRVILELLQGRASKKIVVTHTTIF
jgi:ADP-ribose pyrophosphatase YjhB (NUDIX family)